MAKITEEFLNEKIAQGIKVGLESYFNEQKAKEDEELELEETSYKTKYENLFKEFETLKKERDEANQILNKKELNLKGKIDENKIKEALEKAKGMR